ncbi:MAG TPA: GyrI-like domain-containing protein [Clostridia bacterium]|nr:GyrI-like domain-containing protein [Clostridia bacterium]
MGSTKNNELKNEYIYRINKVQDYIDSNMGDDLSLDVLSNVANFSSYHFHRVFSAIVGEPLSKYIQRIRLEKAALMLVSNVKYPIGQIASKCGFESQASFSRAFQRHFGFSASELRKDKSLLKSKKCKTDSKVCKDSLDPLTYNGVVEDMATRIYLPAVRPLGIEVKNVREMTAVYIRNTGMFKDEPEVVQKIIFRLFRWAEIRGFIQFQETKILSLYHDSPDITEDTKLRTSICITVPSHAETDGDIGKMIIPGGNYVIGHFMLNADEFKPAWDFLWGEWLPESGYQPDERPCFEVYMNNPDEHLEHKSIVDIYIPVKPL